MVPWTLYTIDFHCRNISAALERIAERDRPEFLQAIVDHCQTLAAQEIARLQAAATPQLDFKTHASTSDAKPADQS
jgi:DNA polymerase III delta prime subunit